MLKIKVGVVKLDGERWCGRARRLIGVLEQWLGGGSGGGDNGSGSRCWLLVHVVGVEAVVGR